MKDEFWRMDHNANATWQIDILLEGLRKNHQVYASL
jgi:hypothetical protein